MKITEMIAQLEALKEEHGDLSIVLEYTNREGKGFLHTLPHSIYKHNRCNICISDKNLPKYFHIQSIWNVGDK